MSDCSSAVEHLREEQGVGGSIPPGHTMSFHYGNVNKSIFARLAIAQQRLERHMSYELATKDYLAVDMFSLDGEHYSQFIEADLRQIAIANGYDISPEPGAEDPSNWEDRINCTINLIEEGDGTRVYRAELNSFSEMVKAG